MKDLRFDVPNTEEVEVDAETLAGIDRGIEDAKNGRYVSAEEARKLIKEWRAKFATPKTR